MGSIEGMKLTCRKGNHDWYDLSRKVCRRPVDRSNGGQAGVHHCQHPDYHGAGFNRDVAARSCQDLTRGALLCRMALFPDMWVLDNRLAGNSIIFPPFPLLARTDHEHATIVQ